MQHTGCLGVLTPDTETPEVTETTVSTNLLQPLQVVTELRVDTVGQDLRVLAIDDVPLPVQEPRGDLELRGVLNDGNKTLELVGVELASTMQKHRPSNSKSQVCRGTGRVRTHRLFRSTSAFLQTKLE